MKPKARKAAISTPTNQSSLGTPARKLLSVALTVLFFCLPAAARSWRITDFHVNLTVGGDGSMLVGEQITIAFQGRYDWISRSIPVEYPGPHGSNYTLFLKVSTVTDESGAPLKFESRIRGAYRYLKIFVPNATDTQKTVRINYTVDDGIRFFEDHDELYWNVTGNDWPVPIQSASTLVILPASAAGSLRAQAFTGSYGSVDRDAEVEVEGDQVRAATRRPLPMRGGLTVDVYIPKGVVHEPGAITRALWFVRSNGIVLLPVFAFVVMFTMWWYKGRDPNAELSVAPMYEPPQGMTPAEVGSLVDDSIDPRDITSTLIDLAVRGYLKIEETDEKKLFFHNRDYVFHLLKPHGEWQGLADHEREILNNVFPIGARLTSLSTLKNEFYRALPSVREEILGALKTKGMYRVDPKSAHAYRLVGMMLIAAPFVALQMFGIAQFFLSPLLAFVSIVISLAIVFLFGRVMTSKTLRGVRTVIAILGFKEFMTRVDADRLKRMPPDTFEKFLPYAMALGVEKHWATAFDGIVQDHPQWYVGSGPVGHFNPIFFTNSMHTMSHSAYEAFTASPRSSSTGSGFSGGGGGGGGFSGGGFGGGGGDAG